MINYEYSFSSSSLENNYGQNYNEERSTSVNAPSVNAQSEDNHVQELNNENQNPVEVPSGLSPEEEDNIGIQAPVEDAVEAKIPEIDDVFLNKVMNSLNDDFMTKEVGMYDLTLLSKEESEELLRKINIVHDDWKMKITSFGQQTRLEAYNPKARQSQLQAAREILSQDTTIEEAISVINSQFVDSQVAFYSVAHLAPAVIEVLTQELQKNNPQLIIKLITKNGTKGLEVVDVNYQKDYQAALRIKSKVVMDINKNFLKGEDGWSPVDNLSERACKILIKLIEKENKKWILSVGSVSTGKHLEMGICAVCEDAGIAEARNLKFKVIRSLQEDFAKGEDGVYNLNQYSPQTREHLRKMIIAEKPFNALNVRFEYMQIGQRRDVCLYVEAPQDTGLKEAKTLKSVVERTIAKALAENKPAYYVVDKLPSRTVQKLINLIQEDQKLPWSVSLEPVLLGRRYEYRLYAIDRNSPLNQAPSAVANPFNNMASGY